MFRLTVVPALLSTSGAALHRAEDTENVFRGQLNLRDVQRTWIAYRDATCDRERAQWGSGTEQGAVGAKCLTGDRTLFMESRFEGRT